MVEQADPEGGERPQMHLRVHRDRALLRLISPQMLLIAIGQPTPDFDALALRFPG